MGNIDTLSKFARPSPIGKLAGHVRYDPIFANENSYLLETKLE